MAGQPHLDLLHALCSVWVKYIELVSPISRVDHAHGKANHYAPTPLGFFFCVFFEQHGAD